MSDIAAPQITIYARMLDNITKEEISGYQAVTNTTKFSFGVINGISGGESPVIMEFDIWNNEPALSGGMQPGIVEDATDCTFTAWDSNSCVSSVGITPPLTVDASGTPYIRARCVSIDNNSSFIPIAGPRMLDESMVYNSVTDQPGTLFGQTGGDHTKIQTKIVIPRFTTSGINNFVFQFNYNYA